MVWAAYSVAIGVGAAHILDGHPLLAMLLGIVGGVALGALVSQIITMIRKKHFPERQAVAEMEAQKWAEIQLEDGSQSPGSSLP